MLNQQYGPLGASWYFHATDTRNKTPYSLKVIVFHVYRKWYTHWSSLALRTEVRMHSFHVIQTDNLTHRLHRARCRCLSGSVSWRRFRPATFRQWSGHQFFWSLDAVLHWFWSCSEGCNSEPFLLDMNRGLYKAWGHLHVVCYISKYGYNHTSTMCKSELTTKSSGFLSHIRAD